MSKEIKISVLTESWIREHSENSMKNIKLLELHRIMRQIVSDWGEELISDSEALDMLLTLNCFSGFVESLGE
jgi:hypothetical protein